MYVPNKSVQTRVLLRMSEFSDPNTCWNWPMSRTKSGYGQLSTSNGSSKTRELHYAHRVASFLVEGPLPKGLYVCHTCDNPSCFNPNHLFRGTPKDNSQDCVSKGRLNVAKNGARGNSHWVRKNREKLQAVSCGENNSRAKLTRSQADYIRNTERTGADLARDFNVSQSTISSIRLGKTYKSV